MELDAKTKIRRFCYLGSLEPVYVHLLGPVKVEQYWPKISELCQALDDGDFLHIMRELLQQPKLVRRDEVLFVYAVYLSSDLDIKWKTNVRIAFPVCVRNDDDLFLFCKYAASIQKMKKRKGFSKTIRKAITAWYELQPPAAIQNMWMQHRGSHGYTHKALIKICHLNDDTIGAPGVASSFFRTCTELLKLTGESGARLETLNNKNPTQIMPTCEKKRNVKPKVNSSKAQPISNCTFAEESSLNPLPGANRILNSEPEAIKANISPSPKQVLIAAEEKTNSLPEHTTDSAGADVDLVPQQATVSTPATTATLKSTSENEHNTRKSFAAKKLTSLAAPIIAMSKLRITKNKFEALKIIQRYELHYNQVPGHLLRYAAIMEALIPTMSYPQLLKCWRNMARFNLFDNPKILKLCKALLDNKKMLHKHNIHPVVLLLKLDELGIRENITKLPRRKVAALRMDYLRSLYVQSFGENRGTGLRMHITINLQANYKKKFLHNHKKLSYLEAAVALAFGYYKKESSVDVFRWGDHKTKLDPIPWTQNMTIKEAKDVCEKIENAKNNQRLVLPLLNVLTQKEVYDLFIAIVPSAGRGNPKQQSEFLCKFLDRYRESKNPRAKYVIVNLRKFKRSMTYSMERKENILEICGLDEHTTDLINNFALNRFG